MLYLNYQFKWPSFHLLRGVPIQYGQAEQWKKVSECIGRTKPSCAPDVAIKKRKKNDGRPPDTAKELLKISPSKKKKKDLAKLEAHLDAPKSKNPSNMKAPGQVGKEMVNQTPATSRTPSYPWKENSCWLDTSLQLLFVALTHNFSEFSEFAQKVAPASPLRTLHNIFEQRLNPDSTVNVSEELWSHRNHLQWQLVEHQQASSLTSYEPLFVSTIQEHKWL